MISQLRSNQIIRDKGHEKSVKSYFTSYPGVRKTISIRGGEIQAVILGGARLWVKSHQKKRFVIALRYEGEQEDRYIVATDTTWRMTDIAQAYTIRWLVEICQSYYLHKNQVIINQPLLPANDESIHWVSPLKPVSA